MCIPLLISIKLFDFFPVSTTLKYNGFNFFRTWLGCFFSFLLLALTISFSYSNVEALIYHMRPEIKKTDLQTDNPSFFPMNFLQFPLMFGLSDFESATFFIDESIYIPKAEFVIFQKVPDKKDKEIFKIPVEIIHCNEIFLSESDIGDYFKKQKWNSLYCLKNDVINENYTIGGAFEQNTFIYLRLSYSVCNTLKNLNCSSRQIIEKKLKRGYSSIFFRDYIEDLENYENPLQTFGRNVFTTFGINYSKGVDINFQEIEIVTEDGPIYEQFSTNSNRFFSGFREFFEPDAEEENFIYYDFKMSYDKTVYRRNYIKFQQLMSNVGGLINLLYILIAIMIFPFTKLTYYIRILNDVFELKAYRNISTFSKIEMTSPRINLEDDEGESASILYKSALLKKKIKNSILESSIAKTNWNQDEPKVNEKLSIVLEKIPKEEENSLQLKKIKRSESFDQINIKNIELEIINKSDNYIYNEEQKNIKDNALINNKKENIPNINSVKSEDFQLNLKHYMSLSDENLAKINKKKNNIDIMRNAYSEKILPIFNYQSNNQDNNNNSLNIIDFDRIPDNKNEINNDYNSNINNTEINKEFLLIQPEENRIKLSWFEYFKYYLNKYFSAFVSEKQENIEEGIKKIEESLDVRNILKKVYEIDKLKYLLLDNDQLILFNNLGKTNIKKLNREKTESNKDRFKAYKLIKYRKNKKDIKLVEMLDEKLKVEFDRREMLNARIFD